VSTVDDVVAVLGELERLPHRDPHEEILATTKAELVQRIRAESSGSPG